MWLLLPFDIILIILSYIISFELRFNWDIKYPYISSFWTFLMLSMLIYVPIFLAAHLYTRIWRHASIHDVKILTLANMTAAVLLKFIDLALPNVVLPLSIWLSSSLLTMILVGGSRGLIRVNNRESRVSSQNTRGNLKRVLVFGAGSAGAIVVKEAARDPLHPWDIVGFIDDNPAKQKLLLNGVKVLGTRNDLEQIIVSNLIDKILIAIPSLDRASLRKLVDDLQQFKLPVLIIPPYTRWAVDNLYSQIRPIDVEDLLGRDPLPIDIAEVGEYLKDTRVLVTGAGGSIGSEICRQVAALKPSTLILLGRGENSIFEILSEINRKFPDVSTSFIIADVRDEKKLTHVFQTTRPTIVFHAAAHKHVPLMEEHPDEAFINNVKGTKLLAELANRYKVDKFILISSDKAVRPTNVMGASKRIAEMIIQDFAHRSLHTQYMAVRFGNVLGSRGSVVRTFRQQIATGGPVTVTDERMIRYFMTIPESVRLVIETGAKGESGQIYLFDMGEPVKIVDLARRMIQLSGFTPEVDIPIQFSGIRPGEKLYEELSREEDSMTIDANARIWSVSAPFIGQAILEDNLGELQELYRISAYDQLRNSMIELAWWLPEERNEVAATVESSSLTV
jgi:FlaA1/EpsC-like NDP-sugar epimerase